LQAAAFSQELGTTLLISNTRDSAVTLDINIADSNFSTPITPPIIVDHSGSTLNNTTGTNSMTLTSCVDQSNGLVPPGAAFCSSPAPGMAGPNGILTQTGPGTVSNESAGTITSLHPMFSLTEQLDIVAGPRSNFNVTSSQVLTQTPSRVPEPGAIMLLGTALLGIAMLVRKKASPSS
jgi:PEP-CTERM motif